MGDLLVNPSKLSAFAQIYQDMGGVDFRINAESFCITIHQSVPTAEELFKWKLFYAEKIIPFLTHTSNNSAP